MCAFPGFISAQKYYSADVSTCANPRMVLEECVNACWGEMAERCKNASPATVLEGESVSRTATDTWAHSFAAAETASGLAHLTNLSPPAYGSQYLHAHLPLTMPMRCSVVF